MGAARQVCYRRPGIGQADEMGACALMAPVHCRALSRLGTESYQLALQQSVEGAAAVETMMASGGGGGDLLVAIGH